MSNEPSIGENGRQERPTITPPPNGPLARAWSIYGRLLLVAIVAVLIGTVIGWRIYGQRVDVVVVNESGEPVDFSWQPAPFADAVTVTHGACESHSTDLAAGERWHLTRDGEVIAESSAVELPFFPARVAIEVRIDRTRAVSVGAPRVVTGRVDVPYLTCAGEAAT